MIVDASALLAVILDEVDADRFTAAMVSAPAPLMSAVNFWEVAVRVDRADRSATLHKFDAIMDLTGVTIAAVSAHQATLARRAHAAFGKGRHPAALNLGDCFAYALARETGRPLLFKGDDFIHTDIDAVL